MRHDVVVILNLYKIGLYGRGKKCGFLWWEVLLVLVPTLAEASNKYFYWSRSRLGSKNGTMEKAH
ncbi:unnamed protein product [Prunus armeniaca]|uniref:Uncharacterized protein n=1 Tax=Prunus armeniaca TaxID=36596 RepID=A0A6J5X1C7_PRUAR|nr:unnamed protein product [Prunus armeniaca]